ncbi:MAG: hypothetical protein KDE55_08705 [Novosphingobium sp.]|nr:hypothetical protein [Novosphingobium sp.]
MASLVLKGSVGAGSAKGGRPHNDPDDFRKVRKRFVELGYDWVSGIKKGSDKEFVRTIRLFQCIFKGRHKLDQGDGRIDAGGTTQKWLAADNAPGWVKLFGKSGLGWRCTSDFNESNGGYCSSWLYDGIERAGRAYLIKVLIATAGHPGTAPPLWVREASPTRGGNARGHGSHETGIDVDMRPPLLHPNEHLWIKLPKGFDDPRYNRVAAQAQLEAIKEQMNTRFCFFNDPKLLAKRLCQKENKTHDNHYHVRIRQQLAPVGGHVSTYSKSSKEVMEALEKMKKLGESLYEAVEDAYDRLVDIFD